MTKTGWVISEVNYEYNDEGYDRRDGGNPVVIYLTEAKARAEALKRSLDSARAHSPFYYANTWDMDEDEVKKLLPDYDGDHDYDCSKLDDDTLAKVLKVIDVDIYTVEEVEYGE